MLSLLFVMYLYLFLMSPEVLISRQALLMWPKQLCGGKDCDMYMKKFLLATVLPQTSPPVCPRALWHDVLLGRLVIISLFKVSVCGVIPCNQLKVKACGIYITSLLGMELLRVL